MYYFFKYLVTLLIVLTDYTKQFVNRMCIFVGTENIMSSFKPANSAKLYASPEDMKSVGYRSRSLPAHSSRPQVRYFLCHL